MHLPFIQVTNEAVDLISAEVAITLDADELAILGGLVRLYRWALQRCPDHLPPSAYDVVKGPQAAKLIARAAGHRSDADAYVAAMTQAGALESTPDGIRIRGLDRYDGAWAKNHPDLWRQWKQSRTETGTKPGRNRDETGPESDRQTQTQTQTQEPPPPTPSAKPPPAPPPTAEAAEAEMAGDGQGAWPPTAFGFYGWWQSERRGRGLLPEARDPPRELPAWHAEVEAEAGIPGVIRCALTYLGDAHFAARGWPLRVLFSPEVWRTRAAEPKRTLRL